MEIKDQVKILKNRSAFKLLLNISIVVSEMGSTARRSDIVKLSTTNLCYFKLEL